MQDIVSDLTGVLQSTLISGNFVTLAIVVLVALIAAMSIRNYRQAFGWSVISMLLLGAFTVIYCVATGNMPGELSSWTHQLLTGWNSVMSMTGETLIGYFVMFFVGIIVLFTIRQIFSR